MNGGSPDRFSSLAEAIEHELGVDVLVESIEGNLAGASIVDRGFPFIWVNQDQPLTRGLFTLAHELGHVVSGRGSPITLDFTLSAKSNTERVANAFAAALLMPEDLVQAHIDADGRSAKALAEMISEFGVSFESLVYRLHNLGYINAEGRDQLRARGWTGVLSGLPDSDTRKTLLVSMGRRPEQRPPGLLTMRAFRGYLEGAVSVRPLASLLNRDPDEMLEQLVREQDSLDVLNASYPGDSTLEKEELYSGNPV
jgi:Zn-dependent peptidase ImmA (M78 family)